MPDTGAPWNIPYVEPSDLVRDYPTASEALADAVAAGLSAADAAGIGNNVVSVVKTDTFTTTSTSLTDVTGLSATITPTSATSKVLVIASVNQGLNETSGRSGWTVARGATNLVVPTSPGNRQPVIQYASANFSDGSRMTVASHFTFLDSPATTSATTYVVRAVVSGTTFRLNRGETDNDAAASPRGVSTITLIEVAA